MIFLCRLLLKVRKNVRNSACNYLLFWWCCYRSLNLRTTHCGMFGVFHSLFEFISLCLGVFSISSPSIICRFVESLWNVLVTSIRKFTLLPSCTVLQWLSSMDLLLLLLYFWRCSDPRVYALYEDSPWYKSLSAFFGARYQIVHVVFRAVSFSSCCADEAVLSVTFICFEGVFLVDDVFYLRPGLFNDFDFESGVPDLFFIRLL